MKRIVIGLHIILLLVLAFHLYLLWAKLGQNHSEKIRPEDYQFDSPPVFQAEIRNEYPSLFDLKIPETEKENDAKETRENKDSPNGEDQLKTDRGFLRLRAIFTISGKPTAVLETRSGNTQKLTDARKNETIHGYRVMEVAPGYIRLRAQNKGDTVKLIIFDRDRNQIAPQKPGS